MLVLSQEIDTFNVEKIMNFRITIQLNLLLVLGYERRIININY